MVPEAGKGLGEDIRALPDQLDDGAVELLVVEYEHLGASLLANEETGEKRLNVFLAIVAACIAGLGVAAERLKPADNQLIAAVVITSVALVAYGLVVLRRIIERNILTTEYLNGLRLIRAFFVRRQPDLARVLPYAPHPRPEVRTKEPWWGLGKAGFLETLAVTNCIVVFVAVVAGARLSDRSWPATLLAAALAAVAAWLGQMRWTHRKYRALAAKQARKRQEALDWWHGHRPAAAHADVDAELFRAGVGLVVIDRKGCLLALERTDVAGAWQLPQGGLLAGESPDAAAWRELAEETGLTEREVALERTLDVLLGYELPPEMRSAKTRRGQVHRWFLFRLRPDVELPLLPSHRGAEFRDRRWIASDELVRGAAHFRRAVYERVAAWVEETPAAKPNHGEPAPPSHPGPG